MPDRTFTTEDGVTYPFEGPVQYYTKGEREPAIRSKVYVDYFNMNEPEDQARLSRIMTSIRNNKYQSLHNPVYTTGAQDGHTRIMLMYEYQYACDPSYHAEPTEEVEMDPGKEETPEQPGPEGEELVEVEDDQFMTLSSIPEDSLNSQPVSEQFKDDDEANTEEDQTL